MKVFFFPSKSYSRIYPHSNYGSSLLAGKGQANPSLQIFHLQLGTQVLKNETIPLSIFIIKIPMDWGIYS
jgi:hypothetical protein